MPEIRLVRAGLKGEPGSGGTIEVLDNGSIVVPAATALDFVAGSNVTITIVQSPSGTARIEITATGGGGGGGSGHIIQEDGAPVLPQRTYLNFVGAGYTASDDAGNDRTNVTLDADLNALALLGTTGILSRTGPATYSPRTITGTSGSVVVTNGDGIAGNPTISLDAEIAAFGAVTSAANQLPYYTGVGTATTTPLTAFARTLLDDASQAAMQATLGLQIGVEVQAHDADLDTISALTVSVGDLLIGVAGPQWGNLGIGANGTVLTSDGSTASWQVPAGGGSGVNVLVNGTPVLAGASSLDLSTAFTAVDAGGGVAAIDLDADLVDLITQWGRATTAGPARLHFHEDVDNGTNRVALIAPAALSANVDVTLPSSTGTMLVSADLGVSIQAWDADLDDLAVRWSRATAAGPATLALREDTDNGTNSVTLSAPSSVTADRVHQLPDLASDTLVVLTGAQTLTNKTLTTPIIGDFSSAQHTHQSAAQGGSLDAAAIGSGTLANARLDVELQALAGLTSAADKVPYFTGSGTAALADLGALGRAFIAGVRDTFSNAAKAVNAGTGVLAQTGTMSASRAVTLTAASAYTAGSQLLIIDESGSVTTTNTIVVTRAGADTIDGATTATISAAYGFLLLESDGSSKWTIVGQFTKALVQGAGLLLTEGASAITADVIGVNVQAFSTAGTATWNKPANALRCFCRLVGPGAGGGSGRCGAAGSDRFGGGGGGAGGVREAWLPASAFASSETVTVGGGGTGGNAVGPAAANGNGGSIGGNSSIGSILAAGTGGAFGTGGGGGTAAATAGSPGSLITDRFTTAFGSLFATPSGGDSSITAAGVAGGAGFTRTPGGGGGGGGVQTAGNTERAGGAGGASYPGTDTGNVLNGGNGGAVRTNGSQGTAVADAAYQHGPGGGGGGGSNSTTVNGGTGAAGRQPGGGGGGGGAGTSGGTGLSGAGGPGGDGYVLIVTLLGSGS